MSGKVHNWPLVEVIAEFELPETAWSDDIPAKLREQIGDRFPLADTQKVWRQDFTVGPGVHEQSYRETDRFRFFSQDKTLVVQTNKGLFSVNHLHPYSKWEVFLPTIELARDAYTRASSGEPISSTLRYINRIEFGAETVDLQQQLGFRPLFDGDFVKCGCTAVQPWAEENALISRKMNAVPTPDGRLCIILLLSAKKGPVTWSESLEWLDAAHKKLNTLFKESVTEALLQRYEGGGA